MCACSSADSDLCAWFGRLRNWRTYKPAQIMEPLLQPRSAVQAQLDRDQACSPSTQKGWPMVRAAQAPAGLQMMLVLMRRGLRLTAQTSGGTLYLCCLVSLTILTAM